MTDEEEIMGIIKMRCVTCPECDGWSWGGTLTSRYGIPVLRYRTKGVYKSIYVRRFLLQQQGRKLGSKNVVTKCDNPACVNTELLEVITTSERIKRAHARQGGTFLSLASRAKIADKKRRASKLTDEAVNDIRMSDEHRTVLMERYGITEAYYYMLRKHQYRNDYRNPFLQLAA